MIGTPHYLAPEVVLAEGEGGYTAKVSMSARVLGWCLSVVVFIRSTCGHLALFGTLHAIPARPPRLPDRVRSLECADGRPPFADLNPMKVCVRVLGVGSHADVGHGRCCSSSPITPCASSRSQCRAGVQCVCRPVCMRARARCDGRVL
jgi:hypothetical protein